MSLSGYHWIPVRRKPFPVISVEIDYSATVTDPAEWDCSSYEHHPVEDLEPLPDRASNYRGAALKYLETLKQIDAFLVTARDPRLAWTTVAMVFNLTSVRGWTSAAVAEAIGVSEGRLPEVRPGLKS